MSLFDEVLRKAQEHRDVHPENGTIPPLMERSNAPVPERKLTRQEKTIKNTIQKMRDLKMPVSVWGVSENAQCPYVAVEAYFMDNGIEPEIMKTGRKRRNARK